MWIYNILNTIYWRDYFSPHGVLLVPYQRFVDCIIIGLFLGFPFCSVGPYIQFYASIRLLEYYSFVISSVQSLSHVWLFATPWTAEQQTSLSFINSQSLLKLMLTESVMPSNHLILCHPLFLPSSIFPSIRVFSNESALRIRWPKYWSFSFSISPSSEHLGLTSFRMDWLDLIAVQGTLKSFLQHHSQKHQFFSAQLSL